jgi:hypothetical protein
MSRGRGIDQSEVWADVSTKHAEIGVEESDTGALRHAFEQRRVQLEAITAQFAAPEPGQTGVLCFIGARPVALDAFDRPETLARLWPRMVSGYALDALRSEAAAVDDRAVQDFLDTAAAAEITSHVGVGLGTELVVTGAKIVGHALAWEEGILHVALFGREAA